MAKNATGGETLFAYSGAMQAALTAAVVGGTFLSYHYVEILWHFLGLAFALERVAAHEFAKSMEPAAVRQQPIGLAFPRVALGATGMTQR